uniref:Protein OSB3, chloroplastic/mitochondrial n=1 Tax=Cajanus cajan TaxID=3821 RepID=A0A151SZY6_CAJCA|nr:hypothetical protein KK1_015804 [Cajanus cajan]
MNSSVRGVLMLRRDSSVLNLIVRYYAARKSKSVFPRPPEIPFQPKLSNAVNLIGQVHSPIQFQTSHDGNHVWAATVITRQHSPLSPYLQIPVIFEGDLAHTAVAHLKLNDFIHIAGHLTADPPNLQHPTPPQISFQVMVQTLNFVQGIPQLDNATPAISNKKTFPFPDGELLFINTSTPKWLKEKLESMAFDLKPEPKHSISNAKKNPSTLTSSWTDLLDNPTQWSDFRDKKLKGLVNPKYPDFKRKDGSVSLWLNNATTWVLPKLEGLEFGSPVAKSNKAKDFKGGDESWNDLVQNLSKWWDNRLDKRNEKAPDFKHKETGKALWLDNSPSWVSSKLPPVKPKQNGELLFINTSTPKWLKEKLESMTFDLKPEPKHSISNAKKNPSTLTSSWTDVLDNPMQWSDFRDKKLKGLVNPKYPNFKRKDGSVSLWLNNATTWVLPKLEGLEFDSPVAKSNKAKDFKGGDESWNDLVQNPSKWWDNRLDKRNEKAPDFKHKETGKVLWLNNSPSWVLSKLPPVKPKQSVETGRKQTLVS